MELKKYHYIWVSLLILLTSCGLFGGGDGDRNKPQPQPPLQAKLTWQLNDAGDLDSPPPLIENSSVYIANSYIAARLALADGSVKWATDPGFTSPDVFGTILLDENNLYLRFEKSVAAYRKADGSKIWSVAFDDSLQIGKLAAGTSLMAQAANRLFIGTRKALLIVDKQKGSIERTITPQISAKNISGQRFNVPVAAAPADDRVFLLTSFSGPNTTRPSARIAAYKVTDGSLIWARQSPFPLPSAGKLQSPTLQIIAANNRLMLMTGTAVVAFDARSGKDVWQTLFKEGRTDINIGRLLARDTNGNQLYAVAANRILELDENSGNITREITASGTGLVNRLLIADGRLYYASGISLFGVAIQVVDIATAKSQYRITPNGGPIDGFTSSFSAADSIVVDIGVSNILGYTLSK